MPGPIRCHTMFRSAPVSHVCETSLSGPLAGKKILVWGWQKSHVAASGATVTSKMSRKNLQQADVIVLGGHHYTRYDEPNLFMRGGNVLDLNRFVGKKGPISGRKLIVITGCLATDAKAMHYFRKHFPESIVIGAAGSSAGKLSGLFISFLSDVESGKVRLPSCASNDDLARVFLKYAKQARPSEGSGLGIYDAKSNSRALVQGDHVACRSY